MNRCLEGAGSRSCRSLHTVFERVLTSPRVLEPAGGTDEWMGLQLFSTLERPAHRLLFSVLRAAGGSGAVGPSCEVDSLDWLSGMNTCPTH